MGWESFGLVRFDLGCLLQGQTRIAKLKSAYNSLIIGPRGWDGKPTYRKSWAGNLLVWSDQASLVGHLFGYGRPSGSAGSAFWFPYNSVTVRRILFKFGRFRQQPWGIFLNMLQ